MFDNLREDANSMPFFDDEARFDEPEEQKPAKPAKPARRTTVSSRNGRFLGMTPAQRFFVAVLLFISVCALGSMCLLITGRVGLF